MQVRPWHAFPLVIALSLLGREFKFAGPDDFLWFAAGAAFWVALIALAIWFFTRKATTSPPDVNNSHPAVETPMATTAVADEALWARAMAELQSDARRDGLWARSLSRAQGDPSKAQALYLEERVAQLQKEAAALASERAREAEVSRIAQLEALRSKRSAIEAARAKFLSGRAPSEEEFKLLVSASAHDPSLTGLTDRQTGQSLLHWAVRLNQPAGAAALLRNGASADARNGQGRRALDDANSDFIEQLRSAQREA